MTTTAFAPYPSNHTIGDKLAAALRGSQLLSSGLHVTALLSRALSRSLSQLPIMKHLHRRAVLQAGWAASAALVVPPARACEFFAANLRITHPWTRATPIGAESAVVCMKFDEVTLSDRLVMVETPVASHAAMGGLGAGDSVDFAIPEGQESSLTENGTHVLLTGLNTPLEVGRQYPLKLTFERGGVINAVLSIDYLRFL